MVDWNENECSCSVIHGEIVAEVTRKLAADGVLSDMAEMFKVLGDPTRLKIIHALLLAELCVCDVAAVLAMSKPAVSHHLKILRQSRLVKCRKAGKVVYYSLCDDHVKGLFDQCETHVREE